MPSPTPILDLETRPPGSLTGVNVSLMGLLKAVPAALGLIALIPATILLFVKVTFPQWLVQIFEPIESALETLFRDGPFVAIAWILPVMFLVSVIHETGHAVVALLYKWPISEIRVYPLSIQKAEGGWKVGVAWKHSLAGLVVANPRTSAQFHSKLRVYALGGPGANLITAVFVVLIPFPPGSILATWLAVFVTWSIATGLGNLLPLHFQDLELDGYVALIVSRNPRRLAERLAAMKMRAHVFQSKPLVEMNQRWVALAESALVSFQNRVGAWLAYVYWVQQKKYDRAALMLERMLQKSGGVDEQFKALLFAECSVLGSLQGKKHLARTWKDRSDKFFLPEYLRRRCNTFAAWVEGDVETAYREAVLTKEALLRLDENNQRQGLAEWNPLLEALEKAGTSKTEPGIKPQVDAGLPST